MRIRVTNGMMHNQFMRNLQGNLRRLADYQNKLSSGKSITKPSDDPVRLQQSMVYRSSLHFLEQHNRNMDDALSWQSVSESALNHATETGQRARELLVRAMSGTHSQESLQAILPEMQQLKAHLVQLANTTYNGRHIFSGSATNHAAVVVDESGRVGLNNAANNNDIHYQVATGVAMPINVTAESVFWAQTRNAFWASPITIHSVKGETGLNLTQAGQSLAMGAPRGHYNIQTSSGQAPKDPATIISNQYIQNPQVETLVHMEESGGSTVNASTLFEVIGVTGAGTEEAVVTLKVISHQMDTTGMSSTLTEEIEVSAVGSSQTIEIGDISFDLQMADISGEQSDVFTLGDRFVAYTQAEIEGDHVHLTDPEGMVQHMTLNLGSWDATTIAFKTHYLDNLSGQVHEAVFNLSFNEFQALEEGQGGVSFEVLGPPGAVAAKPHFVFDIFDDIISWLRGEDGIEHPPDMSKALVQLDTSIDQIVAKRAELGSRSNRLHMMQNRVAEDAVTFTKLLSDAEDADMAEVIMYLQAQEAVYRASLATGARLIQPSLVDFLR